MLKIIRLPLIWKIFRPFKIVVSAGFENPHWVINEDDSHYDEVWKNAKYYLKI